METEEFYGTYREVIEKYKKWLGRQRNVIVLATAFAHIAVNIDEYVFIVTYKGVYKPV